MTAFQRGYVIERLIIGETQDQINAHLEKKWDVHFSSATFTKIRKKHASTIAHGRQTLEADRVGTAVVMKSKTNRYIERKIDAAAEDFDQLLEYRRKWQAGKLTDDEYKRKKELYENMTVAELVKVSETAHKQSKGDDDVPTSPQDQAALVALIAGIQAGNPVQLIQVLNQTGAESQAA